MRPRRAYLGVSENSLETMTERLNRELQRVIDSGTGLKFDPELDPDSQKTSMETRYEDPFYSFKFQSLPESRGIPMLPMRLSITVAIYTHGGASPAEHERKSLRARDQIAHILRDDTTQFNLGIRQLRRINDDTQVRGDMLLSLNQYEFLAFARKGEY